MKYRGVILPDWGRFEAAGGLNNPGNVKNLMGAVQAFMRQPVMYSQAFKAASRAFASTGDGKAAMQAFATSGDFPTSVLEVLEKYQITTYFDTGYEEIFNMIDMRASRRNGFEILDVEDGLTFALVPEGAKAKIYKFWGAKATVTLDMYGGGLGWSRRLFDDEEYWNLENSAIAFRNKAYSSKAQDFYDLIEATAATYDLTWQAVTPAGVANTDKDYNAIRDVNTINKACENILTRVNTFGFGATPNSEFIILAPIQLKTRLPRALGIVQQPFAGSVGYTAYNVRIIWTMMLTATDKYYVILPKNKLVGANRMDLTIFGQFDPVSYSDIAVGWQRYGGAVGELKQLVRCSIA
ncbi:MAG: hypothetical protein WC551_09140 [Patescibacteria group bacterium]